MVSIIKDKLIALFCTMIALTLVGSLEAYGQRTLSSMELSMEEQGMVNIANADPSLIIDLRYATSNNFTKTILYDSLSIAYLHPLAAAKLVTAHAMLKAIHPNYRLLIFDVARPLTVQQKMYKVVQGTPYAAYVANPTRTGLHNYGMAVDLSICDLDGNELDMGTHFDFFGAAAGTNKEEELIARGVLSQEQVANRKLLRKVMVDAGFFVIRGEWWHFNAVQLETAKAKYSVIE